MCESFIIALCLSTSKISRMLSLSSWTNTQLPTNPTSHDFYTPLTHHASKPLPCPSHLPKPKTTLKPPPLVASDRFFPPHLPWSPPLVRIRPPGTAGGTAPLHEVVAQILRIRGLADDLGSGSRDPRGGPGAGGRSTGAGEREKVRRLFFELL